MSVQTYTIARITGAISAKITDLRRSLRMTPDFGPPADPYPRRWMEPSLGKTDAITPLTQQLNTEMLESMDAERARLKELAREAQQRGLALTDQTVIFTAFAEKTDSYVGKHRSDQINVGQR
jgi:hypothetical protein